MSSSRFGRALLQFALRLNASATGEFAIDA